MDTIHITKLSRQAGRILSHLNWLPADVRETIRKFPYHCARLFAIGMAERLHSNSYYFCAFIEPDKYLSSSGYGYTLEISKFIFVVPLRMLELLLRLGAITEDALLQGFEPKVVLNPSIQIIDDTLTHFFNQKVEFKTIQHEKHGSIPKDGLYYKGLIESAIDSGAANLDGLKECWLVSNYYERLYYRVNPVSYPIENKIYALDYELPSFCEPIDTLKGDLFLWSKTDGYEKDWPDVLYRNGKYSIVHHIDLIGERVAVTTQSAADFDDIRIPVSNNYETAKFVICKKNDKWGAIFSGSHIFMNTVVPFDYKTPEEVVKEIKTIFELPIEAELVSWNDFRGYTSRSYEAI